MKRRRKLKPATLSQKALEAENEKLGNLLDAQIEQNKQLYDRLELAIDGGRPPPGILPGLQALEPFAAFALALDADHGDGAVLLSGNRGTRLLIYGHLRDAARTLAWWREERKPATAAGSARQGRKRQKHQ